MADEHLAARAVEAGLAPALDRFPDDVKAAAEQAAALRKALAAPLTPDDEPFPPVRIGPPP
jgi:hypothetical protein